MEKGKKRKKRREKEKRVGNACTSRLTRLTTRLNTSSRRHLVPRPIRVTWFFSSMMSEGNSGSSQAVLKNAWKKSLASRASVQRHRRPRSSGLQGKGSEIPASPISSVHYRILRWAGAWLHFNLIASSELLYLVCNALSIMHYPPGTMSSD